MIDYSCHSVGILGGCGIDCPLLLNGDCELPFEIDEQEYIDNDLVDLLNDYKETDRLKQEDLAKKEQLRRGEMNYSFKITKDYIIDLITQYYKGDDSLKNPIRLFLESNAIDEEIIKAVDNNISLMHNHKLFVLDIYLNRLGEFLSYDLDCATTLRSVLNGNLQRVTITQIVNAKNNFYDADLIEGDFVYFDYDLNRHISGKLDANDLHYYDLLTKHKDFPIEWSLELYKVIGHSKYLPENISAMFIF